jgi:hypothetical protein
VFGKIFENLIQTLATTLEASTIVGYRNVSRHFLSYLQTDFPEVCQLSELRRNPHMLGWFRRLCQKPPHLANSTRVKHLYRVRRMLHDFASQGFAVQPGLILREDFPPCPRYLPRALSPEHDQRLQQELRRSNDLLPNARGFHHGANIIRKRVRAFCADPVSSVRPNTFECGPNYPGSRGTDCAVYRSGIACSANRYRASRRHDSAA